MKAAPAALLGTLALIAARGPAAASPGPCALVARADIVGVLHWHVQSGRESPYHLPQSTGLRCIYDADEGSVLVVAPDSGSSFLQNNDLVDPFRNGLGTRVAGIGDSAQMFDNTIYVSRHGANISIAVLTNNGTTTAETLIALGRRAARRMP